MRNIILISFLVAVVAASGVALAVPNPASTYCVEMGYTLHGDICDFGDGNNCSAWDFYNGDCGQNYVHDVECAQAGEHSGVAVQCCEGLTRLTAGRLADDGTCDMVIGGYPTCSDCGNGICEEWENECNCKEDCSKCTEKIGDVNLDGKVNSTDVLVLKSYLAGTTDLDICQRINADTNADAKITEIDGTIITAYDVGVLLSLPNKVTLRGDVNLDGKVDSTDALIIRTFIDTNSITGFKNVANADFDEDGKITDHDAKLILKYDVSCKDSDGFDIWIKGTAIAGGLKRSDYCENVYNLIEYYCLDGMTSKMIQCKNGCRNNACVIGDVSLKKYNTVSNSYVEAFFDAKIYEYPSLGNSDEYYIFSESVDMASTSSNPAVSLKHEKIDQDMVYPLDKEIKITGLLPGKRYKNNFYLVDCTTTSDCKKIAFITSIFISTPATTKTSCHSDSDCTDSNEFCSFARCGALNGECESKPEICTTHDEPVCGCDGNTYSNECVMKSHGASKAHDGECVYGKTCSVPICEGRIDTGKADANGCTIYSCPTSTCTAPTCENCKKSDKVDSNGCPIYVCAGVSLERKYNYAKWTCYDGTEKEFIEDEENSGICRSYDEWKKNAESFCEGHCSTAIDAEPIRCGLNDIKVWGECAEVVNAHNIHDKNLKLDKKDCTQIKCKEGYKLNPYNCKCLPKPVTIKGCTDSDGGKNYDIAGTAKGNGGTFFSDICLSDGKTLQEGYCTEDGSVSSTTHICPVACIEGICVTDVSQVTNPGKTEGCAGCTLNDECIPTGVRKQGRFCDTDKTMKEQIAGDGACDNNYECSSNVCVNNKCVSPSFIEMVMNWFTGLFGG